MKPEVRKLLFEKVRRIRTEVYEKAWSDMVQDALIEALDNAADVLESYPDHEDQALEIRALIKKAKGVK